MAMISQTRLALFRVWTHCISRITRARKELRPCRSQRQPSRRSAEHVRKNWKEWGTYRDATAADGRDQEIQPDFDAVGWLRDLHCLPAACCRRTSVVDCV